QFSCLSRAVCLAADCPHPPPRRPRARLPQSAPAAGALDMLPPAQWWHDPQIAAAGSLTPDQYAQLDKISKEDEDEIARLERDSMTASRDVRTLLDAETPAAADIVTAAM